MDDESTTPRHDAEDQRRAALIFADYVRLDLLLYDDFEDELPAGDALMLDD